jgi:riboflavin synthase
VGTGDSIAVDGACLTAVEVTDTSFRIDAVLSTLERTVAGTYRPGARVNLERAMVMGARLDGHMVQGHVDGMGELVALRDEGGTRFLDFRVPREVWEQTILHGSIALNGISLTVNALEAPDRLQVAIIPHTWEVTNLASLAVGDRVNVEGDLLGKYVGRILAARGTAPSGPDTH